MTTYIGIGFADSRCKTRTYPPENIYLYYNDGDCWIGAGDLIIKGTYKFKQGERVEAHLNRSSMTIEWIVDGQVKHRVEDEKLADREIDWVPMVKIDTAGDIVELC